MPFLPHSNRAITTTTTVTTTIVVVLQLNRGIDKKCSDMDPAGSIYTSLFD
jgi:hypothetical protein